MDKQGKVKPYVIWTGHAHSTIAVRSLIQQEAELVGEIGSWELKMECIGGFVTAKVGDKIYYDGIDPIVEHKITKR